MNDNIIHHPNGTIIMNGGNPLKDCPTDWNEAKKWEDNANKKSSGDFERPEWKFDCGFKLDYDGPIMRVSSRFYPPKTHYGETWDGSVSVCIFDKEVHVEEFDFDTLEELKTKVEEYVSSLRGKAEKLFG